MFTILVVFMYVTSKKFVCVLMFGLQTHTIVGFANSAANRLKMHEFFFVCCSPLSSAFFFRFRFDVAHMLLKAENVSTGAGGHQQQQH